MPIVVPQGGGDGNLLSSQGLHGQPRCDYPGPTTERWPSGL